MKININTNTGFFAENSDDNEVKIEGVLANEYPFNERWNDLYAVLEEGTGATSLTYEAYRNTGYYMRFFRHNQNDIIFMKYQMPHTWDPTTDVRPHMHCIPMASGSGVVKIDFVYTWTLVNDDVPDGNEWISGSITSSFDPSDQYKHKVMSMGLTDPPSNAHESAVFLLKVERPSSDPEDTYSTGKDHGLASANFAVLFFDLHYQSIKGGTTTEYPEVSSSIN